jgi:N-methylhydantoinase A/oxoprolinase/acetone carboxylase beta subunit
VGPSSARLVGRQRGARLLGDRLDELGRLDDARLAAEYTRISGMTLEHVPYEQTASVEPSADVRFRGQSHELNVRIGRPSLEAIGEAFRAAYAKQYGFVPEGREVEVVTVRVRRTGKRPPLALPAFIIWT